MWLVLEHLLGQSLAQICARGARRIPASRPDRRQITDALAAAHALGIEHRDVTSGNVLITDTGAAKLTNFGISHSPAIRSSPHR